MLHRGFGKKKKKKVFTIINQQFEKLLLSADYYYELFIFQTQNILTQAKTLLRNTVYCQSVIMTNYYIEVEFF